MHPCLQKQLLIRGSYWIQMLHIAVFTVCVIYIFLQQTYDNIRHQTIWWQQWSLCILIVVRQDTFTRLVLAIWIKYNVIMLHEWVVIIEWYWNKIKWIKYWECLIVNSIMVQHWTMSSVHCIRLIYDTQVTKWVIALNMNVIVHLWPVMFAFGKWLLNPVIKHS